MNETIFQNSSSWTITDTCAAAVTDLVDIIVEDEKLKNKLLLTNTRNAKNRVYYENVLAELKKRFEEHGEEFLYDVVQTRSKFEAGSAPMVYDV